MEKEKKRVGRPELDESEKKVLIHFGLQSEKVEKLGGKNKVKELSKQLIERYHEKNIK
jgi:hypothetical protein